MTLQPSSSRQKFRSVITDISESLEYDGLAFQPRRQSELLQIFGILKCFADAELNSTAGGFAPAVNSALRDRFAGHASEVVDAARNERVVGIGHPGHLAFAGSDVGPRNVFTGTDVFLANQFRGESARDLFDLLFGVFLRIERTPPFEPPKGTSTMAHLYVIKAASAMISSWFTSSLNRVPPLTGFLCWLCSARQPSKIS